MRLIIPALLIVTVIVFLSVRFILGAILDLIVAQMGELSGITDLDIDYLKRIPGMDASMHLRYARWLGVWPQESGQISGRIQGDFGVSLWSNESVLDMLMQRLPVSLEPGGMSLVIALLISLPIGVFPALFNPLPAATPTPECHMALDICSQQAPEFREAASDHWASCHRV